MLYSKRYWRNLKIWIRKLLKGKSYIPTCYTAGPMEFVDNHGLNWRITYSNYLQSLNIKTVIPNLEEAAIIPDPKTFQQLKLLDTSHYIKIMRQVISWDLKFVEDVDFIITRWNGERGAGTIGEAQHAYLVGTPNYLITELEVQEIPGWFLACFSKVFHHEDDLFEYISRRHGDE